eukprot:TRINITY_DN22017_c0_g1_i3.p1 TRINITY_DN22017_c0_g1~~TRINITY_DN22017_c0_g1_i3.p1  ORF type:complete len:436 (+),score=75.38 TRINITY_DN22017_c0_g1_i3:27-1310(+)
MASLGARIVSVRHASRRFCARAERTFMSCGFAAASGCTHRVPLRSWTAQCRGVLGSSAAASGEMTTDATFRYQSFQWRTSSGDRQTYEYVVAQQPAGGGTARDALAALEEHLPRPPSGWTLVLIPSVSMVCSGKEEMRPLATLLSQRGHRCYLLEWPGWTQDVQTNWALERCKLEHFREEYEDFWSQALEHVAMMEDAEVEKARQKAKDAGAHTSKKPVEAPRLCIVAAGSAGIYALRALKALRSWEPLPDSPPCVATSEALSRFESLVLLGPSWTTRRSGLFSYLKAERAADWMGAILHSDSRIGKMYRRSHFSRNNIRRHFLHKGAGDSNEERLFALASWLFDRPRPYAQTDAVAACGFLDPAGTAASLASELGSIAPELRHGVLLLSPSEAAPASDASALATALEAESSQGRVEHRDSAVDLPS